MPSRKNSRFLSPLLLLPALLLLAAGPAGAATRTWLGAGADNHWKTSGNWDTAPVAGDTLLFGKTVQQLCSNDYVKNTAFGGIIFTNGGWFVNGNDIVVTNDIATGPAIFYNPSVLPGLGDVDITNYVWCNNAGGGLLISNANVGNGAAIGKLYFNTTLTNTSGLTVGVAGSPTNTSVTLKGIVGGTGGLTKTGPGLLNLNANAGVSTYPGDTTISAGVLRLGGSVQFPSGAGKGNLVLNGVLDMNGATNNVNGLSGSGAVTNGNASTDGQLLVGNNNVDSTFSGAIYNHGTGTENDVQFIKVGSGYLDVTAATFKNYTTHVTNIIAQGVVKIATGTLANKAELTVLNGGLLDVNGAALVDLDSLTGDGVICNSNAAASSVIVGNQNNGSGTFNGSIMETNTAAGGAGGMITLTKAGTGNIVFTKPLAISSLWLTNRNGILTIGANNTLPVSAIYRHGYNANNAALDLNGHSQCFAGIVTNGGYGIWRITNSGAADSTLTISNTAAVSSNFIYTGFLSDGAHKLGLTVMAQAQLTLNGDTNTYSGPTLVTNAGSALLQVRTTQTGGGAFTISDGATLGVTKARSTAPTLAMSALTLGDTAGPTTNILDCGPGGNLTAPLLNVAGTLTVNGTVYVNLAGSGFAPGQFTLIKYGAKSPNSDLSGSFLVNFLPSGVNATIVDTGASIDLNITAAPFQVWAGADPQATPEALTAQSIPNPVNLTHYPLALPPPFDGAPDTIVVSNFDNSFLYTLGSDYTLVTNSGTVGLVLLSGGSISAGNTLQVSYSYFGAPDGTWGANPTNWFDPLNNFAEQNDNQVVQFDDSAPGTTRVILANDVTPGAVIAANQARTYGLGGTNAIRSGGKFTLQGGSTMYLTNLPAGTTNYWGDTEILAQEEGPASTLVVWSNVIPIDAGSGNVLDNGTLAVLSSVSLPGLNGSGLVTDPGVSGAIQIDVGVGGHSGVFTGVINEQAGGTISVHKTSAGVQTFSGASTYSGGTLVDGGILQLGADNVLGSGPLSFNGGALSSDSTTARALANSILLAGPATYGNAVHNGTLTLSGPVDLGGGGYGNTVLSPVVLLGQVQDGTLVKLGASILTLNGNNTYAGGTTNSAGTLQAGRDASLGSGPLVFKGGALSAADNLNSRVLGNFVVLSNNTVTLGDTVNSAALTFTNAVNLGGWGQATLTTPSDVVFANVVTNGNMTKAGAGTLTLNGPSASMTGNLFVNGGTYVIDGCQETNGGGFRVQCQTSNTSARLVITNGGVYLGSGTASRLNVGYTGDAAGSTNILDVAGAASIFGASAGYGMLAVGFGTSLASNFVNLYQGALLAVHGVTNQTTNYAELNFYGGTLLANSNDYGTSFISTNKTGGALNVFVHDQGAVIDDGGYTLNISLPLLSAGSGGLTKQGSGSLTLSANNTYVGPTVVGNGTLLMAGSISNSAVTVQSGATLGGTGIIGQAVAVNSGGTLAPGPSPGAIGSLAMFSTLALSSGSTTAVAISKSGPVNTNIHGLASVTYGGTLVVNNLGASLAAGDSFKLFDATPGNYFGAFAAIVPATPGSGLSWDPSGWANGLLSVVSGVPTNPTNIIFVVTNGNQLDLSWPADHLGWRLEEQTNNLSAGVSTNSIDWGTVPGSASTNHVVITNSLSLPAEFFRMVYP